MDISLDIKVTYIRFSAYVQNIHMEGTVSQIFDLGFSFCFILKKRVTFCHFLKVNFPDFIKQKVRPK